VGGLVILVLEVVILVLEACTFVDSVVWVLHGMRLHRRGDVLQRASGLPDRATGHSYISKQRGATLRLKAFSRMICSRFASLSMALVRKSPIDKGGLVPEMFLGWGGD
jgi:hypothetical protein